MNGSVQNRDAFLQKIAKRLGREKVQYKTPSKVWSVSPQEKVFQHENATELLEVLKTQCTKIHTDLLVTTRGKLTETLSHIVKEYGGGPIVTWQDERMDTLGLKPLFEETWPQEQTEVHIWDSALEQENITFAEQANIGITFSDITLAESGTVVNFIDEARGRTVSFLPLKSIMIIPKSTIVPRMTQAVQMMKKMVKEGNGVPSCVQFITGPSNSADIEMNLVVGVHGPVNAAYIVIEDE